MATFYLLPARPILEDSLARLVDEWLPGLPAARAGAELADALQASVSRQRDVILIFREELPELASTAEALRDGFGAEPGDEIVALRLTHEAGAGQGTRWARGRHSGAAVGQRGARHR